MKHACSIKVYLDKLAEARRVVVLERLCITECFQERVGVEHLLFNCEILVALILLRLGLTGFLVEKVFLRSTEPFACSCEVS